MALNPRPNPCLSQASMHGNPATQVPAVIWDTLPCAFGFTCWSTAAIFDCEIIYPCMILKGPLRQHQETPQGTQAPSRQDFELLGIYVRVIQPSKIYSYKINTHYICLLTLDLCLVLLYRQTSSQECPLYQCKANICRSMWSKHVKMNSQCI